jgi:hypothetical protein
MKPRKPYKKVSKYTVPIWKSVGAAIKKGEQWKPLKKPKMAKIIKRPSIKVAEIPKTKKGTGTGPLGRKSLQEKLTTEPSSTIQKKVIQGVTGMSRGGYIKKRKERPQGWGKARY